MPKRNSSLQKSVPRVALIVETSRAYGRGILRGVKRYVSSHGQWSIFVERRALESPSPRWLKSWEGDGILARFAHREMVNQVRRMGVPAVDLRLQLKGMPFPAVRTDDHQVGVLAAEHFLTQGYRNFACLVMSSQHFPFHGARADGYHQRVAEAGFECRTLELDWKNEVSADWEAQQSLLTDWILEMPQPVGILTGTDQLGFWLLDACLRADVLVPEQVAVVGVEDDEPLCNLSTPPLSSVRVNAEAVGYEAAALLDRMMRGGRWRKTPVVVPPIGVTVRQSSDAMAVSDPVIAMTLSFIRKHACEGIHVKDVLEEVLVSRSSLERRMRELLGRSPNAEINRVRLETARRMLVETDLSLEQIADRCGFNHVQYFSKLFRAHFEETPGRYRARCYDKIVED